MKRLGWRRSSGDARENSSLPSTQWVWGPTDIAITAGMLLLTVGVCVPTAWQIHREVQSLDQQREQSMQRFRMAQTTLQHLDGRRTDLARLRREVNRYVADVEARPVVPWTTVVGELSRRRPDGVWTMRLSGNGPTFKAEVAADQPNLLSAYTRQLRESPYMEFVSAPPQELAAQATPTRLQVVGRLMGE